jgi:hypothetical protein
MISRYFQCGAGVRAVDVTTVARVSREAFGVRRLIAAFPRRAKGFTLPKAALKTPQSRRFACSLAPLFAPHLTPIETNEV